MDFRFLTNIFFPPSCVACGRALAYGTICERCKASIAPYTTFFCPACEAGYRKKPCHSAPYALGAAGRYDHEPLKALIHALKFGRIKNAADPLAEILEGYLRTMSIDVKRAVVVPIPLSRERERERGFNQSALIAERLCDRVGAAFERNALLRVKHRKPQSEIADAGERRANVRGCFAANKNAINDRDVILLDDVTTTGATFFEAARALRTVHTGAILALAAAKA